MRGMIILLAVMLLASPALVAAEMQVNVTTIDGEQLTGNLAAWNTQGLTIEIAGEPTEIAAERLLAVRQSRSTSSEVASSAAITSRLQLVDGTILPLTDFTVADHQATVATSLVEQPLTITTAEIRLLEFAPFEQRVAELWSDLAEKQLDGDVLIVHKKKRTTLDYLTGLLGDVSSEQVVFNFEGDEIPVKRSKVAALGYFHARQPELSTPICWLKTRDGALLPLVSLTLENETLELITTGGLNLRLPLASSLEVDYSMGKVTYLSDLQPIRQEWTPRIEFPASAKLINQHGAPRSDQSFSGSTLTLRWPVVAEDSSRSTRAKSETKMYPKGLALRSRTVLQYRLPQQMQRFIAIAGIDPATADQGNVQLSISADDQVVWQGEIDGSATPVEIECEIGEARKLQIEVDYGSNLDFGDRLHLVEARVSK